METFIILGNFTQQGAAKIKESPARVEAARKAIEAAGGKMQAWYLTLGRHDFVCITQAPSAKAAAGVLLGLGSLGNVRTETLQALSEGEFKEIVGKLK